MDYKEVAHLVDIWVGMHKDEWFNSDEIARHYKWLAPQIRQDLFEVLYYLSHTQSPATLEKKNKLYKVIDRAIVPVSWWDADEGDVFDITFPKDDETEMEFGFAENVIIYPGEAIVIAGVSNTCKSGFCMNLAVENADKHEVRLMSSEPTKGGKLKARLFKFPRERLFRPDGSPKFEIIERRHSYKYVLLPDGLNIIDWINLAGDRSYDIGGVIEDILSGLNRGVVVIVIQKGEDRDLGRGKDYSRDLASLYLSIDPGVLTVVKAKSYNGANPNFKKYAFDIVERGTKFHNVREVDPCPACRGRRYVGGGKCQRCIGKGWVEKGE